MATNVSSLQNTTSLQYNLELLTMKQLELHAARYVPGHLYHVHALFRQGMFLNSTAATVYLLCLEGLFCLSFGIFAIQRSRPF